MLCGEISFWSCDGFEVAQNLSKELSAGIPVQDWVLGNDGKTKLPVANRWFNRSDIIVVGSKGSVVPVIGGSLEKGAKAVKSICTGGASIQSPDANFYFLQDGSVQVPQRLVQALPGGGSLFVMPALDANTAITKLITLPTSLSKHTHFFACVIALASIVHVSRWSALLPLSQDEDLKQQLKLSTGALKMLREVWPCAEKSWGQVKGVVNEIFKAKKAAAEVIFWSNLMDEEAMRTTIEDEGMMEVPTDLDGDRVWGRLECSLEENDADLV